MAHVHATREKAIEMVLNSLESSVKTSEFLNHERDSVCSTQEEKDEWEFTEDMKKRQETTLPAGTERMVSIQIQFRQHCSLQGFLICGKQKAGFRSALELLYLLEDCLQEQEKQDV